MKQPCAPSVGADVELLVHNSEGTIVPCVGYIKGTKDNPMSVPGFKEGYAVQEDNVMLEFNVPPVSRMDAGPKVIARALTMCSRVLSEHNLKYTSLGETTFRPADLQSNQAKTFGCDPDFDAYAGGRQRNNPPKFGNTRSCGGHVHLGGDFKCPDFVAALFAEYFIMVLGDVRSILPIMERDAWYGKPGVFRSKPYGIEYRTPSNLWVFTDKSRDRVYTYALYCARWLTKSSALDINNKFREINWSLLNRYVSSNDLRAREEMKNELMKHYNKGMLQ